MLGALAATLGDAGMGGAPAVDAKMGESLEAEAGGDS